MHQVSTVEGSKIRSTVGLAYKLGYVVNTSGAKGAEVTGAIRFTYKKGRLPFASGATCRVTRIAFIAGNNRISLDHSVRIRGAVRMGSDGPVVIPNSCSISSHTNGSVGAILLTLLNIRSAHEVTAGRACRAITFA